MSLCCIAVIHIQPYTYTCGNKINNNEERTRFFRKIYLSHFMWKGYERVMCERWVGDWTETATYWPPVPLSLAALLSRSAVLLNRGSWRPPSAGSWFSLPRTATNWLQLTELPVTLGYIIVWCPPASCERHICTQFNLSTVKVISWYLRLDTPVSWSTAGSEVNMLHLILTSNYKCPSHCLYLNKGY